MMPPALLGLRWAIRRSFIDYIERAPGGRIVLGDGAAATPDRDIVFAPDQGVQPGGSYRFRGSVTFSAHSGALLVPVADPVVTLHDTGGAISIIDPFDPAGLARLSLAVFIIDDHLVADGFAHWSATDVRLAPEACVLFNHVYPADAVLEQLTIIIPVAPSR